VLTVENAVIDFFDRGGFIFDFNCFALKLNLIKLLFTIWASVARLASPRIYTFETEFM